MRCVRRFQPNGLVKVFNHFNFIWYFYWSSCIFICLPCFHVCVDNKTTLSVLHQKLSVHSHQFNEMRDYSQAANQAKRRRKRLLGNTNSNMNAYILYRRTDLNVLKCIVPLPQFHNACARVYVLYKMYTYAASVALHTCVYYVSELFRILPA